MVLGSLKRAIKADPADLYVFPENALYISINSNEDPPQIDFQNESFFTEVADLARAQGSSFILGSLPRKLDGRWLNSVLYIDDQGNMSFPYDKIHMFSAKVGDLEIDEGLRYHSGAGPQVIGVKGWKVGLSVCFDLRFAELYKFYRDEGCDLVVVPSAFFRKTGRAHWETLLRARAIESQFYVIAPGQVGVHRSDSGATRKSYGHSMAIDPWGSILFEFDDSTEEFKTVELQRKEIDKVRRSILMKKVL